jgi:hypothetical protein
MPENDGVVWEEYHDRSAGLVIFGLLQLGMAVIAVLLALLMGLSSAMTFRGLPNSEKIMGMVAGSAIMCIAAAILLAVLGIGSMMARRWARSLSLAVWGFLLAYGVYTVLAWVLLAPVMMSTMDASMKAAAAQAGPGGGPPPGMASFMLTFMIVMAFVVGLGVPLPFVLFYRSRHVKATCEWRDPVPRWTDSRPVPLLASIGVVIMLAFTNLFLALNGSLYIGLVLHGLVAAIVVVILVALYAAAAVGFLRMRIWGWWLALVTVLVQTIIWLEAALSGRTEAVNYMTYMPGNVPGAIGAPGYLYSTLWTSVMMYVFSLLFILWARRYFVRPIAVPAEKA